MTEDRKTPVGEDDRPVARELPATSLDAALRTTESHKEQDEALKSIALNLQKITTRIPQIFWAVLLLACISVGLTSWQLVSTREIYRRLDNTAHRVDSLDQRIERIEREREREREAERNRATSRHREDL